MISTKLVLALLVAVSGYTGYAIPGEPPRITAMSHDDLARQVCGRPCQVFGFTLPSGEILIDEALAIGTDPAATSILVHELTHFLQIKSTVLPVAMTCDLWNEREREAYDVQYRWLREQTPSIRAFTFETQRLVNPILPNCAAVAPLPTGG